MKKAKRRPGGFTLVELIVVIAIIGILAALLAPAMVGYLKDARRDSLIEETRTFVAAARAAVLQETCAGVSEAAYDDTYNGRVCEIVTNFMLSKAQQEDEAGSGDPANYAIAKRIINNATESTNLPPFHKFTGSTTEPIGMSINDFSSRYPGVPGMILIYTSDGEILLFEYGKSGMIVRFDGSTYSLIEENATFSTIS